MTEIINLNQQRKAKAKVKKQQNASENRIKHGRTKEEKQRDTLIEKQAERFVQSHRREINDTGANTMSYDSNNIFAKILRQEIPCNKVYEDEYALAFHDIHPDAPVHVLVIPKGNYTSFDDFSQNAPADFLHGYLQAVQKTAKQLNLQKNGYRLITNHGADASQSVPHFHMHILGGKALGKLLP